ncbi:hypothetical protein CIK05_01935 [Bdellovibrio sp. qaytius]|nr:hypothetical protein CIK05_01935 [Bdellovibrio sp. qaytius]
MKLNKKIFILTLVAVIGLHLSLPHFFSGQLLAEKTWSQQFYDRNKKLLRLTLSGDEKYRFFTSYKEINPKLVEAFLDKEDQFFYYHPGVNPAALSRAIYKTFVAKGKKQGASTITMQVVRLLYPETTKSISGKLLQIVQALKLEALYSKDEILLAYLNWTPFGSNLEGVGAACFFYFKNSCEKLTPEQIQFLVQIPQNPQKFTPQANETKKHLAFRAPHFIEYLKQSGVEDKAVNTTLDINLQENIEVLAESYFKTIARTGVKNYSLVIVDTNKNEIISYIGSRDYFNSDIKGQIDANRSLKPPGSTLKPFIYGLALQQGLIHEKTLLKDTRMTFAGLNPENFDEQFLGPMSADQALILSRNLPAVDLARRLENPSFYEFMKGKSSLRFKDEKFYGLSLPLGGVEMSLLDLLKLYASLAHQGKYSDLNITLKKQKSLPQPTAYQQILTPEAVYIVTQMLKKNPRTESLTLQELTKKAMPLAWKTGTSKSYKDAWTMGLIGNYAVGIWFGDNDREMNPALVGRNIAAPLYFQIYDYLRNKPKYLKGNENPIWDSPVGLNVKKVHICSVSKKLVTENCGHKTEESLFIPSVSSIETCTIHRKVFVDPQTQKMSCKPPGDPRVVEVWPDDLLAVYKEAGLKKVTLSEKKFSCDDSLSRVGQLSITSPQENIEYLIQTQQGRLLKPKIQLRAISESDSQYLDWFVNKNYVGRSFKSEPMFFETAVPGRYSVSVNDNLGRSQSSYFNVKVISQ